MILTGGNNKSAAAVTHFSSLKRDPTKENTILDYSIKKATDGLLNNREQLYYNRKVEEIEAYCS